MVGSRHSRNDAGGLLGSSSVLGGRFIASDRRNTSRNHFSCGDCGLHLGDERDCPMNVKFSVEMDGKTLASQTFEIIDAATFETACREIWRLARTAKPITEPKIGEFLSGLDGLWGASMKLEPA
jgi:hypothetical protein